MKRSGCIWLIVILVTMLVLPSGCTNVFSSTGTAVNPYAQWSALDSVDLTPLVAQIATQISWMDLVQEGLPEQ